MQRVLAIDSGGTKCDALLVDEEGVALGWGRCAFADPGSGRGLSGSGRARETVVRAVTLALGEQRCDVLHLVPGFRWLQAEGCLNDPGRVIPYGTTEYDGPMALAGATEGVVALAGTGAFVWGRTRDGRTCHLDGLGPNLGDYGSGFQIGVLALRAAARSGWHPRHHTSLAERVYRACVNAEEDHYGHGHGLVAYSLAHHDRAEIASLARIVGEEALRGDRIAREILQEAATSLADTLYDVVERLGIRDEEYLLIGTGSIATRSDVYWEHFCRLAHEFAPRLQPFRSPLPPVVGMALTALQQIQPQRYETVRQRLLETAPGVIGPI
ncbi:MAG: hypothetical protein GX774_04940 [Armatimonadetes bacterium]|jgi:N-acetylglucosamine kinase-like BadF-type ATPase|nr:hypothetical protein [Armatimonadota bacterium]